jgi:hypothetical protein
MATHSNGGGTTMDNYDVWLDYGPANWDIPHRFVASYLYDLPFFKNSPNTALRLIVGGWQVSGVTTLESGTPVNVTISQDVANTGSGGQRPNLVGALPELNCQSNTGGATQQLQRRLINCFDASAFAMPTAFTFGNAGRNILRGPKSVNTDLSLMKNFVLRGDTRLQVRVEMYNVFNNVNYGNPNATFGVPLPAAFGTITSAGAMRRIQLGGKLIF